MEAKDLRIGNYYDNHGQIMQVTPNTIEEVWIAKRIWCKPIILTEEWLIKFGFEKRENFDVYENIWQFKGFMVSLGDYINIHVDWADKEGDGYHSLACYEELFVHTLQNIYFALTLNELKLIEK